MRPIENLFMSLVPGVEIVALATTPKRLLQALLLAVDGEPRIKLHACGLSWQPPWSLDQDPDTWPNPLTIRVTIGDEKGNIEELALFQIQQTHAEKVRLAIRGNPELMKLAPIALQPLLNRRVR